jgi:hypothetical protein
MKLRIVILSNAPKNAMKRRQQADRSHLTLLSTGASQKEFS